MQNLSASVNAINGFGLQALWNTGVTEASDGVEREGRLGAGC